MSEDVVLREGTRRDNPAVAELCGRDDYLTRAWPAWMRDGQGVGVIAESEGRIVGCVHASPVSKTEVFSQGLRVDASYRRQGIAARLMQYKNALAHDRGFRVLRSTVGVDNHAARALCKGLGMRRVGAVFRRYHPDWRGASTPTPTTSRRLALELAGRYNLLASRPALGHFKRFYYTPSESWLEEARLVAVDSAVAVLDRPSAEGSHWLSAVAGPPDALRQILEALSPPAGQTSTSVTVDATDDPALHHMLDRTGFEPTNGGRYLILEGPTGAS